MPFGDRRGPYGEGPRTGRGFGYCSGYDSPGYTKNFPGMRAGRGTFGYFRFQRCWGFSGRGRGWRNMFYATGLPGWARYSTPLEFELTSKNEKGFLENQLSVLENQIESLKKRLSEIEEEKEQK